MKYSANSVWENKDAYDIVVVGAGHAGCEAALACARLGLKTIVFTVSVESIAMMPCNPNIGGTSKGHLSLIHIQMCIRDRPGCMYYSFDNCHLHFTDAAHHQATEIFQDVRCNEP